MQVILRLFDANEGNSKRRVDQRRKRKEFQLSSRGLENANRGLQKFLPGGQERGSGLRHYGAERLEFGERVSHHLRDTAKVRWIISLERVNPRRKICSVYV